MVQLTTTCSLFNIIWIQQLYFVVEEELSFSGNVSRVTMFFFIFFLFFFLSFHDFNKNIHVWIFFRQVARWNRTNKQILEKIPIRYLNDHGCSGRHVGATLFQQYFTVLRWLSGKLPCIYQASFDHLQVRPKPFF